MSAQDDLMAAFGEPKPKKQAESTQAADALPIPEDSPANGVETEAGTSERAPALGYGVAPEAQAVYSADTSAGAPPNQPYLDPAGFFAPDTSAGTPPNQPYLDPAAFFAQLHTESAPQPKRRRARLILRYASVLVLAGAVGAGTAYAVTLPRRTDVPFLATPSDGRYTFPAVMRPAPPVGEPAPGADANVAQIHYGDLRQYLVPAPNGAVVKPDEWEPVADFESSITNSDAAGRLDDAGLRHVARRSWTMSDGQSTVVELLQFPDHQAAYSVQDMLNSANLAKVGREENVVPVVTVQSFGDATFKIAVRTFDDVTGQPGHKERRMVFGTGDVVAVVTTTAPAAVPLVPTEQVAMLEAQMLR